MKLYRGNNAIPDKWSTRDELIEYIIIRTVQLSTYSLDDIYKTLSNNGWLYRMGMPDKYEIINVVNRLVKEQKILELEY